MKFLCKWTLPDGTVIHRYEDVARPDYWGQSVFWYCSKCSERYASAEYFGEPDNGDEEVPIYHPPWHGIAGLCPKCPGHRFALSGTLEAGRYIGWHHVPFEVVRYQLLLEIAFLDHPDHPHNKGD